jgi:hypothetical protein
MVGLMNECNTCIHRKNSCGILLQEQLPLRMKYKNNCMCKECILKANCSNKCIQREVYIDQLIRELRDIR